MAANQLQYGCSHRLLIYWRLTQQIPPAQFASYVGDFLAMDLEKIGAPHQLSYLE